MDAHDLPAQGRWWSGALGWPHTVQDDEHVVEPVDQDHQAPLVLEPVPEPKTSQNRLHLDLRSDSVAHQRELVEQLLAAGATRVDVGQRDVPWVVLADPEGNELCVLEPRDLYAGTGPVAAVVMPAQDMDAQARYWQAATGWDRVDRQFPALRHPAGGPFLELLPAESAPPRKDRVHLDVRPLPGHPQDEEVARLLSLGARPLDVGQADQVPWVVLADPEGNAHCVLGTPPG